MVLADIGVNCPWHDFIFGVKNLSCTLREFHSWNGKRFEYLFCNQWRSRQYRLIKSYTKPKSRPTPQAFLRMALKVKVSWFIKSTMSRFWPFLERPGADSFQLKRCFLCAKVVHVFSWTRKEHKKWSFRFKRKFAMYLPNGEEYKSSLLECFSFALKFSIKSFLQSAKKQKERISEL